MNRYETDMNTFQLQGLLLVHVQLTKKLEILTVSNIFFLIGIYLQKSGT